MREGGVWPWDVWIMGTGWRDTPRTPRTVGSAGGRLTGQTANGTFKRGAVLFGRAVCSIERQHCAQRRVCCVHVGDAVPNQRATPTNTEGRCVCLSGAWDSCMHSMHAQQTLHKGAAVGKKQGLGREVGWTLAAGDARLCLFN